MCRFFGEISEDWAGMKWEKTGYSKGMEVIIGREMPGKRDLLLQVYFRVLFCAGSLP
jgi:hypothetical protein